MTNDTNQMENLDDQYAEIMNDLADDEVLATVNDDTPEADDVVEGGDESLSPRDMALIAAKAADERKATDIMVLEVGQLVDVTDYFVIVTARNVPQVESILDYVEECLRKQAHIKPISRESTRDRSWEILDYGRFVVDVFQPEAREYYRLENLWGDAPMVDLAEAGITDPEYSERIAQLIGRA